jgi:plastocyanin
MTLHRALSKSMPFVLVAALAALGVSCGGGGSSPTEPTTGGTTASVGAITITGSGVSPHSLAVRFGAKVTIMNNDSVAHEFSSNPHPIHTDCPELNAPVLSSGQTFTATMASKPETCGFHDHLNPDSAAFQGTIVVSAN